MPFSKDKIYTAVLCDIIDSRKYNQEERLEIQERIDVSIKLLNKLYCGENLLVKANFSAGDSIQALFSGAAVAFDFAYTLKTLLYPAKLRVGIGIGTIDIVKDDWEDTNQYYGNAYYFAKNVIDEIPHKKDYIFINKQKETLKFVNAYSTMFFDFENKLSPTDRVCNTLMNLFYPVKKYRNQFSNDEYKIISDLINDQYNYAKSKNSLKINNLRKENKPIKQIIPYGDYLIDAIKNMNVNENYEDNLLPRGSGVFISSLLNMSKQNISLHLNNGIKECRMYYKELLNYLETM